MKKIFPYLMILLTGTSSVSAVATPENSVRRGWQPPKIEMPSPLNKRGIENDPAQGFNVKKTPETGLTPKAAPQKIIGAGEMLMGYSPYGNAEFSIGMNRLKFDGQAELLWSNKYSDYGYLMTTGYLRNGRLCSFFKLQIFSIEDYRYLELDPYTGEILEDYEVSLSDPVTSFDNYLPLYISATYDPTDDTVWGYTSSESGSSYSFFKASASEPGKPEAIIEKESYNNVCASICYNPKDNFFYGVNRDNNFVKIDREGNQTVIMPIGKRTAYARAALIYIPGEDCFLWNCQFSDGTTGLWTLDPVNKEAASLVEYQSDGEFPVMLTGDTEKDAKAISSPIIDEVDFGLGQQSGTISFFMPSALFNGQQLTGDLDYTVYLDWKKYAEGSAPAGKKVSVSFDNLTTGYHAFSFETAQGEKQSPTSETILYIGYDKPSQPQNVTLSEDKITWDKVTRGENAGYLDIDNLTYHVYLNGEEIAATKESVYTLEVPFNEAPYCGYVAKVVADNGGILSEESQNSNMITTGAPWELDVHITPTIVEGQAFSAIDANGDGSAWSVSYLEDGTLCLRDPVLAPNGNDDWLFTPPMNFDDMSTDYKTEIDVANLNEWYRDLSISVYLCDDLNPNSAIIKLIEYKPQDGDLGFNKVSQVFSIPETGVYYLAFHVTSKPYQNGIRLRNINVFKTGTSISRPAEVANLKATGAPKGELSATIELEFPLFFLSGEEIPSDAELEVEISSVSSTTLKGHPGDKSSTTIETIQGDNIVTVTPYFNGNSGHQSSINVYCGQDVPGPVRNMTAYVSEDNLSMHVFWEEPTNVGDNGYYVDPSQLTYRIYYFTENGWEVLEELGNDAREYTVSVNPGEGMRSEWIGVVPVSVAGESPTWPWMSDMLGTPYSLPVNEEFEGGMPTYSPIRVLRVTDEQEATIWSMTNPRLIHDSFANESGICLVGTSEEDSTTGRLMLPKFSTEGTNSATLRLNIWTGMNMAQVRILGETYGHDELFDLGTIPQGSGWEDHLITLPEEMQDKKWIALYIQAYYPTSNYFTLISSYSLSGDSGVEGVGSDADSSIFGSEGKIVIKGHEGKQTRITTVDGKTIKMVDSAPNLLEIYIDKGIYIVTAGDKSSKVIVK